jgi:hypothetical protein
VQEQLAALAGLGRAAVEPGDDPLHRRSLGRVEIDRSRIGPDRDTPGAAS